MNKINITFYQINIKTINELFFTFFNNKIRKNYINIYL